VRQADAFERGVRIAVRNFLTQEADSKRQEVRVRVLYDRVFFILGCFQSSGHSVRCEEGQVGDIGDPVPKILLDELIPGPEEGRLFCRAHEVTQFRDVKEAENQE